MWEIQNQRGHHHCAGAVGLEVICGAVAAIVGGLTWAGIVLAIGHEGSYVACGVGLLVGLAVVFGAKKANLGHGMMAGGLAVGGVIFGKLMILQWAAPGPVFAELPWDLLWFGLAIVTAFQIGSGSITAMVNQVPDV